MDVFQLSPKVKKVPSQKLIEKYNMHKITC